MKLLLDTHAFFWWDESPNRLGATAFAACLDTNNELVVSTASIWEIQLKQMIGKLTLRKPLRQMLQDQVQQNGLEIVPVGVEHILSLESRKCSQPCSPAYCVLQNQCSFQRVR